MENKEDPRKQQNLTIPFSTLFRFANTEIKIYIFFGTLAAIINGIVQPLFYYVQGTMYGAFSISNKEAVLQSVLRQLMYLIMIGISALLSSWIMYVCWMIAGQKQTILCKKIYLNSMLSQQIGWFDVNNQSQLPSIFDKSTISFNQAIGQKIPTLISIFCTVICQLLIAIIKGWQLGLVTLSSLPLFYLSMALLGKFMRIKSQIATKNSQEVDGKVEEVISTIKTVKSMNGQEYESFNLENILNRVYKIGVKYSIYAAIVFSINILVFYLGNALAYWYGSQLIFKKTLIYGQPYNISTVLGIIMVAFSINEVIFQLEPALKKIIDGKNASINIFNTIDRVPLIDKNQNGIILNDSQFKGVIKFQNVKFAYPKQPNKIVLENISFEIMPNQRVAFVGESGCGKSTITQLIMRFYDPQQGRITLDGIDLKSFNLHWLRSKMGYVSQQPVLFATSIRQNLLMANPNATQQQLIQALKTANAYDFTMELIDKMDTYVGEGGTQISGGQKQRIAIARALLKKGKIIMFDQATSALDMNNEILIQQTLQEIKGMTTINVAHRVSTIQNSDIIFVIAEGRVIESGKFHQIQKFKKLSLEKFKKEYSNNQISNIKPTLEIKKQKIMVQQQNNLDEDKKYQEGFFFKLFLYRKEDIPLFMVGCIFGILFGLIQIFSKFFNGYIINAMIERQLHPQRQSSINFLCAMLTLLAFGMLIINSIKSSLFWVLSQNIALQMRIDTFKKLLRLPIWWFDNPKNKELLSKLPMNFKVLGDLTSNYMLSVLRIFTIIIFSIALGFYYDWKLTLISMAFLPFMFISSILQNRLLTQITNKMSKDAKKNLIHEGILNIRTLYSINGQYVIQKKYAEDLEQSYLDTVKKSHIVGLFFGISICSLYISTGLLFYISTLFVQHNNLSILDSIISRSAIISAGFSIITSIKSIPDFVSGKSAAISIFKLLGVEDEQEIQIRQKSRKLQQGFYRGNIEIKNLNFKYPQRNTDIFKNLNLSIQGGSKVAFVGQSGAGKSTILQLLLRFYEPQSGQILLDGINIKDFDLHYLRSIFGIVSQEPVLFNASFKQNIKYNQHSATQEDIIAVSKQASAYDFIEGNQKLENLVNQEENESILVKGFDRNVGIKGSHISGGQKQRVAIARVMLRKPKIILLDQATSALDKINEKLVQTALDKLMVNKTSITVAHRLDTIRNSDKIIVIKSGEIVQEGTYKSLVTLKGQLYNLERGAFINYSQ